MEGININELERQKAESIKNTGKYIEINLLIGEKDEMPIAGIEIKHIGLLEIAMAIQSLQEIEQSLLQRYPIVKEILKHISLEETIEVEKNSITKRGKEKQ